MTEILDVNNKRPLILFNGKVYTLSDELAADITASHVRAQKTNIPIKTERREFKDRSRNYLLSQIHYNGLVSGIVHLPEGMDIIFPNDQGEYKTMEQKGGDLIFSFASRKQVDSLALNQYYDLQAKKDQAELARLNADLDKVKNQIAELESGKGLTPLGKQLLINREESEKQNIRLAELNSQLGEISVKIEELKVKMKARKFVFSGEVYLRQ